MADVNVNIRGRDDGLGQHLDSLRQKAAALGNETAKLNSITSQTPTQQRVSVEQSSAENLRSQRGSVKSDYNDIRKDMSSEYASARQSNKSGQMSDSDFDGFKKQYQKDSKDLDSQENKELSDLDKDSARSLRLILKELQDQRKIEQETNQRDNTESQDGGSIGSLKNTNRTLRSQQNAADDPQEISRLQGEIDSNNSEMRRLKRGESDYEGEGGKVKGAHNMIGLAGTVGSGDLVGSVMKAPAAMESAGILKETAVAGGLITATMFAAYQFAKQDENLREKTAPLAAMRGVGGRAGASNDFYRSAGNLDPDGLNGNLGLDHASMMGLMIDKAKESGIGGKDLRSRALGDIQFQKGFGADSGQFSQYERFGGGDTTKTSLDILNVLTSIEESSLKSDDLVTLSEKMKTGETIMSLQRQKRDSVDGDGMLRLMAGFEAAGLSGKGERSGEFMRNTIEGLGEGGSDNVMMLKFEAMKNAHPEKANDPAALRKMIKFHSDDPAYIMQSLKQIQELSGGSNMAEYDLMQAFFPNANEKDMEIYKKAGKTGSVQDLFMGKGLSSLKQRKAGLDETAMSEDAQSGTGNFSQATADFTNKITEMAKSMTDAIDWFTGGGVVNTAIVANKTLKPSNNIKPNGTKPK